METPGQFQLELAVDSYLQQLQLNGNYTPDDIEELKSHLLDEVDDLQQKQLNKEEAFMVAKKRLGKDEVLNREYTKVNGNVFYNRDLFVMVFSICTYLLFSYIYSISQNALQYLALSGSRNITLYGIINYALQIIIVSGFVYLVFNNQKYLKANGRLFAGSPANFSAILITLVVVLYFVDFGFSKIGLRHVSGADMQSRYYAFRIDNTINDFTKIILGSIVLVSMFAAFITSYKKVNFLHNITNNSGYIALFLLGFFWDAVASSARMLQGIFNNNTLVTATAFGVIWFAGMLIFNLYVRQNIIKRNAAFIVFGFVMEFVAGMWFNPHLKYGMPVSVYFITLVMGAGLGLLLARIIKRKSTVPAQ
jgi:hypothetical protein